MKWTRVAAGINTSLIVFSSVVLLILFLLEQIPLGVDQAR
jgi:hypothetical protein